jgi:hypothetical protein
MRHYRKRDPFLEHIARFADGVRRAFPHCPPGEEHLIAGYSCTRGIGRLSADPYAIQLAVAGFVMRRHTVFEERMQTHGDRHRAKAEIKEALGAVLAHWRTGRSSLAA